MTPKEKAQELVEMFICLASDEETTENGFVYSEEMRKFNAKQCALIAVDEIINNDGFTRHDDYLTEYWQEVKQEIENL